MIIREKKIKMRKEINNEKHRMGMCPVCKSSFEYGNYIFTGQKHGYDWKCHSCGSEGIEWSMFIEHQITFRIEKEDIDEDLVEEDSDTVFSK